MDQSRIRVHCPDCLDVCVAPAGVSLRVCVDDARWSYWFICPSCGLRAAAETSERPALEAVAAGAQFESWRLPAELNEQHDGSALQLMDLVDFQLDLLRIDEIDVDRQEI